MRTPSRYNVSKLLLTCVTAVFVLVPLAQADEDKSQNSYPEVPAKEGEVCTVCGTPLSEDDVALIVKGRRVPIGRAMVEEFLAHQDKYFAKLQPKGALFQEELDSPEGTSQGGISFGWFLFGLYVLIALLFGGLSGYSAVSKGLTPIPHFFIGFFFSAIGYMYVLARPRKVKQGEIPPGLVKVPVTSSPVSCPSCGYTNHPTAQRCSGCHADLTPLSQSEVSRVS